MVDGNSILEALRTKWQFNSQEEISKASGVSRTYICELLSGKADVYGLTLKKINKLFPKAVLKLDGDSVSITADHNSGNVVGVNNGEISSNCMSAVLDKILESEELSDAEKVKVMRVLKK